MELIGGTYGQPMGTMFSGESNIRQIVVGREVIRKALGYEMVTFLEEEEFTHPQIPQIAAGAGFRYASLAQVDTWGPRVSRIWSSTRSAGRAWTAQRFRACRRTRSLRLLARL